MKVKTLLLLSIVLCLLLSGCGAAKQQADVIATTRPVYDFTSYLCAGTDITVERLITENVSCLHDYTLQVRQMLAAEAAQVIVISGAGMDSFLEDVYTGAPCLIDASAGVHTLCAGHHHGHEHHDHHHSEDPHIWLSTENARMMCENIYQGLCRQFPQQKPALEQNYADLRLRFDELEAYGKAQLENLSTRNMVTFHDGFSYFAQQWELTILHSLEEESGSEASAQELKSLCALVTEHQLPAIFTEEMGSVCAAQIVAEETGIRIFRLNMGMSEKDYFQAMYQNIDAVKEALG